MAPEDFAGPNALWKRWVDAQNHRYTRDTHRIVVTMPGGRVGTIRPTYEALYFMCGPGGYWNGYPLGFLAELARRKACPIIQEGRPCTYEAARRYVLAQQWGGRSCEEAWEIIGQVDLETRRGGVAHEIMHVDELPKYDENRNAWRRSLNGGPVYVFDAPAHAYNNMVREAA